MSGSPSWNPILRYTKPPIYIYDVVKGLLEQSNNTNYPEYIYIFHGAAPWLEVTHAPWYLHP